MAPLVKKPPANVGRLGLIPGGEDPLEKGVHPSPVSLPRREELGGCTPRACKESDTTEVT